MDAIAFDDKLDAFIEKWCGENAPHLLDTDENDGERFREYVRQTYVKRDDVVNLVQIAQRGRLISDKVANWFYTYIQAIGEDE